MSAIIKVPRERLGPKTVRNIARKNWGLTWEQMKEKFLADVGR